MTSGEYDVAVVGAGISGLVAATRVLAAHPGVKLVVVEAQERVGGRTHTCNVVCSGKTCRFDLGGQWVGDHQSHILTLLEQLDIAKHEQFYGGKKVLDVLGKQSYYTSDIPMGLGVLSLIDTQLVLWKADRMAACVPSDDPWLCPKAGEWDAQTAASFFAANVWFESTYQMIVAMMRIVHGCDLAEVSLLHVLWYAKSSGGFDNLSKGNQKATCVGGAQQISERLAERLKGQGVIIHLGTPVTRIVQQQTTSAGSAAEWTNSAGVELHTKGSRVSCVRARRVIFAAPPHLATRIEFSPSLPPLREQLQQRQFGSSTIKCIVAYESAFWRDKGFSGEVVSDSDVVIVFDETVPQEGTRNAQPALVAFIGGASGRYWAERSIEARRNMVVGRLASWFGEEARTCVRAYQDCVWNDNVFTGGCPVGNYPPAVLFNAGRTLRTPIGSLHWASTETATVSQGFMDGAVEAGERAAQEVSSAMADTPTTMAITARAQMEHTFNRLRISSSPLVAFLSALVILLAIILYY